MNDHPEIISGSDRLSRALAEELKLPLTHILRQVEISNSSSKNINESLKFIETNTETAINLIDNFLLSAQLNMGQLMLELEPVSITSTLYDVANELSKFAKMYDCNLKLDIKRKHNPVIANKRALITALTSLGYGFIESTKKSDKKNEVNIISKNTAFGVTTGIFSKNVNIDAKNFNRGQNLYGFSRQPISSLSFPGGASIYIAGSILQAMASRLRVTNYKKTPGLGVDLLTSRQMTLV